MSGPKLGSKPTKHAGWPQEDQAPRRPPSFHQGRLPGPGVNGSAGYVAAKHLAHGSKHKEVSLNSLLLGGLLPVPTMST